MRRQLVSEVTGEQAIPHLRALERIADADGGNRASPGPGYEASVDYVAGVLRQAGWDVSTPTYPISTGQEGDGGRIQLRNVVAQTRTGSKEQVVMAGAHLDSVAEGPGINDNATGVAALLEIAQRMGGSPQIRNAVRFAFWGSEEGRVLVDELAAAGVKAETTAFDESSDYAAFIEADIPSASSAVTPTR